MIKGIFFDIDGTLFSHTMGCVPPSTREALEKLDTVRRICARYRVRAEVRGYSQATYIREEVIPA